MLPDDFEPSVRYAKIGKRSPFGMKPIFPRENLRRIMLSDDILRTPRCDVSGSFSTTAWRECSVHFGKCVAATAVPGVDSMPMPIFVCVPPVLAIKNY